MSKPNHDVDLRTFVSLWQVVSCVSDLLKTLGIADSKENRASASQQAIRLRAKGVPLKKMQRGISVGDVEPFIRLWNEGTSVADVAKASGLTLRGACTKASRLRKRGHALKNYRDQETVQGVPLAELKQLAAAAIAKPTEMTDTVDGAA